VAAAAPAPPEEKAPPVAYAMRQRLIGIAIALAMVALAGLANYWYSRPRTTELNLFWKPLLEDASGAVICVGQPLRVDIFEGARTAEWNEKMVGTLNSPPASPEVRQKTSLSLSELRSAGDR
jgi:hypothetical protein